MTSHLKQLLFPKITLGLIIALSSVVMSLWLGDLGFWLATWGAGVFVSKGGDTIVSCAGSEAESLRCLVDASTTVLSGAAIILGGHSQGQRPDFENTIDDGRCFLRDIGALTANGPNVFNGTHILSHNLTGGCDDVFCKGTDYGNIIRYAASDGHYNGITQCIGIVGFDQISYRESSSGISMNHGHNWSIYLLLLSLLTVQVFTFNAL